MKTTLLLLTAILALHCSTLDAPVEPATTPGAAQAILEAVNDLRSRGCRCGLKRMPPVPPLSWDSRLEQAAQRHAEDMAQQDFFSHQGSDGSNVSTRAREAGFAWRNIGENIAYNYPDAAAVVAGWQESTSHCRNMMSADFKQMGAAVQEGYWVQVLGRE
ncbi:CAP domain-containing protein [Phaeodactylibacter sp.]|uniref:CAP domain-containing protein n=1 Tax=Phaeodactylibacter sp. TaxID=1940289 RepID=UPI0025FCE56A|nr:CAP domain-containing protein [Phaeodactylibacter sp.]MCI4647784.1 CAP domain-containing protein [Phaeodactylibacter sp.]MCI5090522.1 CAP domain-containing protein [Phaeodactylibacter sp.]